MQNENAASHPAATIGLFVYNGAEHIRGALDTLLAQDFRDFELLIADNASTDGTEVICRDYAGRDSRIRYVRHPSNIGPTANAQFVVDNARAEFFMWGAHDDTWYPDYLGKLMRSLRAHPECSLAYGVAELMDVKGKAVGKAKNSIFNHRRMRVHHGNPPLWNAMVFYLDRNPFRTYGLYRTTAIQSVRLEVFLGSSQNADNLFLLRLISRFGTVEVPDAFYQYRVPDPAKVRKYIEVECYKPPRRFDIEWHFLKAMAAIVWGGGWARRVLASPILLPLFGLAYLKPLLSRLKAR